MPSTALPARRPGSERVRQRVRLAALVLGLTLVVAVVSLLLFFVVHRPFGRINDVSNAAAGWIALLLAVLVRQAAPDRPRAGADLVAAALGAVGLSWGTYLVVSGTTGFQLAGLVSSLGIAASGVWVLLAHASATSATSATSSASAGSTRVTGHGSGRLGRLTGWLMVAGILVLPGVLAGVDDPAELAWHSWLGEAAAWLGFYVLLPTWCFRLARSPAKGDQMIAASSVA